MKKSVIRTMLLTFGIVSSISLIPNVAAAKSSVRIDLPGISIGLNDRYSRNYYNNNRYNKRYRNNRYQRNYSPRYRSNSYRSNRYRRSNQYYYQPSRRIYTPSYQSEICPDAGYSPYYYEDHGCYQHKDHYHCN